VIKLQEILNEVLLEKLCKKGKAYYDRRRAAGEKPSAYLSGRAVKVCKGLMEVDDIEDNTIIYPDFQGSDIAENISGEIKILKVNDCIGNEPNKDLNYFNTEKKSYVEKMIKVAKEKGIESFPPVVALNHPLLPGKYLILDGNHRLGAFKIGNIPEIKAIILNNSDVKLATPETEWEEGIVPETISLEDAKSNNIDLKKYFNVKSLTESLRDWFKKEDWVRIDTQGNITGPCGTMKKDKATTRCLPRAKANRLTKAERAATARKKVAGSKKGKQFVANTDKAKVKFNK
jgi:hypothetical protein